MTAPTVRVAHVIGSTGLYGAERWILALMRSMGDRRTDCTVVNLVDEPGGPSAVVQAARNRNLNAIDFHTGGRFNPSGILRFAGWVRRNGIQVLHAHGYKSDIFSLFAARIAGRRVISTPHGWSKEKDRKLMFYETLDRWCLRHMDLVCPLSPELREDLKKCGIPASSVRYIQNGVDLDEVDHVIAKGDKPAGVTVIGYVGQLIERKNIPHLLKAFHSAVQRRENLRLWVVGEGPLREHLHGLCGKMGIADRVRFTGYCEDALGLVKHFDVFVLPSLLEGIPRCLMEAMALGIPVIASDIPGNRDLVEHGQTGTLFPLGAPGGLADAILSVLDTPDESRKMCAQARGKIERLFSATRMAKEYLSQYRELAGTPDPVGA